eukprot:6199157-Pleurochrysis_carterae.AAC.7
MSVSRGGTSGPREAGARREPKSAPPSRLLPPPLLASLQPFARASPLVTSPPEGNSGAPTPQSTRIRILGSASPSAGSASSASIDLETSGCMYAKNLLSVDGRTTLASTFSCERSRSHLGMKHPWTAVDSGRKAVNKVGDSRGKRELCGQAGACSGVPFRRRAQRRRAAASESRS